MLIILPFFSCQEQKSREISATVYKGGKKINDFKGSFYSTKSGGLNYYISNENNRNQLFNIQDIDSIIFLINEKKYTAEPLVRESFSRERNDSDFSFSINKESHKIIVDEIDKMNTLSIFSEKTDMEELKEKKVIEFTFVKD